MTILEFRVPLPKIPRELRIALRTDDVDIDLVHD